MPLRQSERFWAIVAPLTLIVCFLLGPVLMLLVPGRHSDITNDNARRALDFQITYYVALIASGLTTIVLSLPRAGIANGLPALGCYGVVFVGGFVLTFRAAFLAARGRRVSYPFSLRIFSREGPDDICDGQPWRARTLASLSQLSVVGGFLIIPLMVFAVARSPFVRDSAARAFNFQLCCAVALLTSGLLYEKSDSLAALPALVVFLVVWVGGIVLSIREAFHTWRGGPATYPVSLPLLPQN